MNQRDEIEMARWREIQKLRHEVESKNCSWFWRKPVQNRYSKITPLARQVILNEAERRSRIRKMEYSFTAEEVNRDRITGLTIKEIGKKYGVSRDIVRYAMNLWEINIGRCGRRHK